tara:strand:- start:3177 stop:3767 length:591 start_codon:yes stop_codon:yes gene_type:complete
MAAAKRQRRCIVTGAVNDDSALIRFVADPGGVVVPDIGMKLPGRGAWTISTRDAVAAATKAKLFSRALGVGARAPDNLASLVEDQLARQCLDLLGLARRAGEVVAGFSKVRAWIRSGRTAIVLHASDGSQRERGRLMPSTGDVSEVTLFSSEELGLALGRESVVHAAVAAGGIADRLLREVSRLKGFRESGEREVD